MAKERRREKERKRDRKAETLNHLSIHQWVRSAIFASQQLTSPIGFPFLKLPPSPCAVLLVKFVHFSCMIGTLVPCIRCLHPRKVDLGSTTYARSFAGSYFGLVMKQFHWSAIRSLQLCLCWRPWGKPVGAWELKQLLKQLPLAAMLKMEQQKSQWSRFDVRPVCWYSNWNWNVAVESQKVQLDVNTLCIHGHSFMRHGCITGTLWNKDFFSVQRRMAFARSFNMCPIMLHVRLIN